MVTNSTTLSTSESTMLRYRRLLRRKFFSASVPSSPHSRPTSGPVRTVLACTCTSPPWRMQSSTGGAAALRAGSQAEIRMVSRLMPAASPSAGGEITRVRGTPS